MTDTTQTIITQLKDRQDRKERNKLISNLVKAFRKRDIHPNFTRQVIKDLDEVGHLKRGWNRNYARANYEVMTEAAESMKKKHCLDPVTKGYLNKIVTQVDNVQKGYHERMLRSHDYELKGLQGWRRDIDERISSLDSQIERLVTMQSKILDTMARQQRAHEKLVQTFKDSLKLKEEETRPMCSVSKTNKHQVFTELIWNGHRFQALVDSGCAVNVVHPRIVNQYDVPYQNKDKSYGVNTIDGKPIEYDGGRIKRETAELSILIQGHKDKASFDIIDTDYDFVLGRTWLKASNPSINWRTDQLRWDEPEKPIKNSVPEHRSKNDSYEFK